MCQIFRTSQLVRISVNNLLVIGLSLLEAIKISTNSNTKTRKICSKHLKQTKEKAKRETTHNLKTSTCLQVTTILLNIVALNKTVAPKAVQTKKKTNRFTETCLHSSA